MSRISEGGAAKSGEARPIATMCVPGHESRRAAQRFTLR